jgi:hypothetical protein
MGEYTSIGGDSETVKKKKMERDKIIFREKIKHTA